MSKCEIRKLDTNLAGFDDAFDALLERANVSDSSVIQAVTEIIQKVRAQGDQALLDYTRRFDGYDVDNGSGLELPRSAQKNSLSELPVSQRNALTHAASRIRSYHERQGQQSWDYTEPDGTVLGQRVSALERVGIYVPGGKAAYPSTVLMTAIPAQVAGVGQIIMVVPAPAGEVSGIVLAAAELAGVSRVFTVGGAQAIAAMAYGTETIPAVDKIAGPGNIYVTMAKRMVFGQVGIDMIAGPSEVVVVYDGNADPQWVAMDLLAQAEHDELAQSILIATDNSALEAVDCAINELLPTMERREVITASLQAHGALIAVQSLQQAVELVNRIAPEHLQLVVADPTSLMAQIRHAGAIFLGPYSAEALGDYCAGPSHVLPTSGTARFSSPLGVYDFQKRSSVIICSSQGGSELGKTASVLARSEMLTAHARSAEYRVDAMKD
ncbi:MAG: histidinol dehydrogenase [Gammaproteobacteria bacterium]|nr:histidinol dehydrogenase [Gammaproteobacteria bacterium]